MTSDPFHRCPYCGSVDPHRPGECRTLGDAIREAATRAARAAGRRVLAAAKWLGLVQ